MGPGTAHRDFRDSHQSLPGWFRNVSLGAIVAASSAQHRLPRGWRRLYRCRGTSAPWPIRPSDGQCGRNSEGQECALVGSEEAHLRASLRPPKPSVHLSRRQHSRRLSAGMQEKKSDLSIERAMRTGNGPIPPITSSDPHQGKRGQPNQAEDEYQGLQIKQPHDAASLMGGAVGGPAAPSEPLSPFAIR